MPTRSSSGHRGFPFGPWGAYSGEGEGGWEAAAADAAAEARQCWIAAATVFRLQSRSTRSAWASRKARRGAPFTRTEAVHNHMCTHTYPAVLPQTQGKAYYWGSSDACVALPFS